jgi:hypothetical protein
MLSSLLFFFCSADARGIFNNPSSPFSYNLACLVGYIAGIAATRQQDFNTPVISHPSSITRHPTGTSHRQIHCLSPNSSTQISSPILGTLVLEQSNLFEDMARSSR